MKKTPTGIVYSPSDLIVFLASPFASWMDRYYLENPSEVTPDAETEEQQLIMQTGIDHELRVLEELRGGEKKVVEIERSDNAIEATLRSVQNKVPTIFQAALKADNFAGYADFIFLNDDGGYQVWDTKLAHSPKAYYALQLCCYSEMFAATTGQPMPERFGIILGNNERVELRVEDFIHYYRHVKNQFLEMQSEFDGNMEGRPIPHPRADHFRWTSHADAYLDERDHMVRVANISIGQIKKLEAAGIDTLAKLADAGGMDIPKLSSAMLEKLAHQARLQRETRELRQTKPDAPPVFEILPQENEHEPTGLAALPPAHAADVFFDMEGYPLLPGGLEYLFGATTIKEDERFEFHDWWAFDRESEKTAFEGFIDWVHKRWLENAGLHIYHYASYEVTAVRNLSTRHDTRQEQVDDLLRHEVFVDLYKIVRQGLRIGEDSYSIKRVERLYRPARSTEVGSGMESVVAFARWMQSGEPRDPNESNILRSIRDYNKDDCDSTAELALWLRKLAAEKKIEPWTTGKAAKSAAQDELQELKPEVAARLAIAEDLRAVGTDISRTLADLVDYHRREDKPMWWKRFDRAQAEPEQLRDDSGCISGVTAFGGPEPIDRSLLQRYNFDPDQECKRALDDKVMFTFNLQPKFTLYELDLETGTLALKLGKAGLTKHFAGEFPQNGHLIPDEFVGSEVIQTALTEIASGLRQGKIPGSSSAILERLRPAEIIRADNESVIEAAIRITAELDGGCLVIQGPPGTGKTYTAARVIKKLIADGKKIGVSSNSKKAIMNLLSACGEAVREDGGSLSGVMVGCDKDEQLFHDNPDVVCVDSGSKAHDAYQDGVIGGTAWVFTREEWIDQLDYLFFDEAGQVPLANVVAMSRAAKNLVLMGDQMQLEQPIQGKHPGDSGMSALQYALKDLDLSVEDAPQFHAVVPSDYGLFLGESRRMHPNVCTFISESIYEGRLSSHPPTANQKIEVPPAGADLIQRENGVVFLNVEHEGNIQSSEEEVAKAKLVFDEMLGRRYTASDGTVRELGLEDFLFIAPYNAQVRGLQRALPEGARVGSVDKFQGQEAPVCILTLCSSCGEYGSRGLKFILDRSRLNVAISRAQCLAVVIGDGRIAGSAAGSIEEMRLLNLLCKLVRTTANAKP